MHHHSSDYPRPQLVRNDWILLNGTWDFAFDDEEAGLQRKFQDGLPKGKTIQVPFAYETRLSGIGDPACHPCVWYERKVSLQKKPHSRILLHFEGADYESEVYVNGSFQGSHRGAYERFTFDITEAAVEGENRITVCCRDTLSAEQPRGKQRWEKDSFGCWYVQTTGIWKSVWLETVPDPYLERVKLTPNLEEGTLSVEAIVVSSEGPAGGLNLAAEASFSGQSVAKSKVCLQRKSGHRYAAAFTLGVSDRTVDPWGIRKWSPEDPALYDLELTVTGGAGEPDTVYSYFGMREIRIENGNILLNGAPIYLKMILDQGYWPSSGITPPSEQALVEDIEKIQKLGFNGLRKHMKIEDERFLYWCDVKGMLVWSEMAAAYAFTDQAITQFTDEWMQIVQQNYNHPAIITWTPFNESWGIPEVRTNRQQQNFTEAIYHLTKSYDAMRPVIVNDGWEHTVSDILTLHDYEEDGAVFLERYLGHRDEITSAKLFHCRAKPAMAEGYDYRGQPILISEYGGIAFSQKKEGEWGYGNSVDNEQDFLARFEKITDAIKQVPYITGYCYTQVSDVEQEVNGLMTADRAFKVDPEKIRRINEAGTPLHG